MVAKGQFGVNRICQLTGLSKATYYAARNPAETFESKYQHFKNKVEMVIEAHPAYGIKRIKAELKDQYGLLIGKHTLAKLLKLWGLDLKRKIKTRKANMIQKILIALADRTNLLIRSCVTRPFQALTSDITELKFKGGRAYWCVHKDVHGQMVYGWSLDLNMKTALVVKSLKMAQKRLNNLTNRLSLKDKLKLKSQPGLKQLNKPKPLIHQDRGSQYTSYSYIQAALSFAVLSYSNPGTPTHNAGQESFFGRFKSEWADEIAEIETFEELKRFVENKVKYYNYERRHTSIGLVSPWEYTKSFLKNC